MATANDNEDRYEDILKRISERRPFGVKRREIRPQTPHERALDRINAYDCLAELPRQDYEHWMCYGPKSLRASAWAGVVVWAHRKGYHGYQTLTLLGVWAQYNGEHIVIGLGERELPYSAPVYDAGVYRVAIQGNFKIYYDDTGRAPGADDQFLYRHTYSESERLRLRQALRETVRQWKRDFSAG